MMLNKIFSNVKKIVIYFMKENTGKKLLNDLSKEQKRMGEKILELSINRVLRRVYINLEKEKRVEMEKIFVGGDEKEKNKFIKKNIPNFEDIVKNEVTKIREEMQAEILKQSRAI